MSFKVQVMPSGLSYQLEEGESVLNGALRNGINLPYGCRNAVCGACKGKLLSGKINYNDTNPEALSDEEQQSGQILFCCATPSSDISIEAQTVASTSSIEIRTFPCSVHNIQHLAPDVIRLYLKLPETQRMQFFAGQYIDIVLDDDRRRSFSIANAPHDDKYIELHIRHVDHGDYTSFIFNEVNENDTLNIEGPFGDYYLRENSTRPIILMAGGTGFAPIKGIIEHAIAEGITRPIFLYWGARTHKDLYLHELAQGWGKSLNLEYRPVLSNATAEDHWQGRQGLVHEAIIKDFPMLDIYEVYASGPPVMVRAGHEAFTKHGMSEKHFFSDSFEFANDYKKPGAA